MLPNFESLSGRCRGVEQVVHLLVVDLHVADLHLGLPRAVALRRRLPRDALEQRVAEARDQALVLLWASEEALLTDTGWDSISQTIYC